MSDENTKKVPDITVVMPCYNSELYVREAIDSVLAQEGVSLELIVIDDGSTDSTLDILASYGTRIKLLRQEHKGACAARNKGLYEARSEFIYFFDSDDVLLPGALKALYDASVANVNDHKLIVFGRLETIDASGKYVGERIPLNGEKSPALSDIIAHPLWICCPLHRKKNLIEIGGFDERLTSLQDHDLNQRLAIEGYVYKNIETKLASVRVHYSSHRITIARRKGDDPEYHYNFLQQTESQLGKLIESENVKEALAFRYWGMGRLLIEDGVPPNLVRKYFRRAKVLYSGIPRWFTPRYKCTVLFLGPILTERIYSKINFIVRRK